MGGGCLGDLNVEYKVELAAVGLAARDGARRAPRSGVGRAPPRSARPQRVREWQPPPPSVLRHLAPRVRPPCIEGPRRRETLARRKRENVAEHRGEARAQERGIRRRRPRGRDAEDARRAVRSRGAR